MNPRSAPGVRLRVAILGPVEPDLRCCRTYRLPGPRDRPQPLLRRVFVRRRRTRRRGSRRRPWHRQALPCPNDDDPARPARRRRSRATASAARWACGTTTARRPRGATASSTAASRIAAWRLRALGLEPGDRILTWSPSTPELPAAYFGAMRARLVLVPLDLRMSPTPSRGSSRRPGPATSSSAPAATPRTRARPASTTSRPRRVEALCAEPAADDPAFPPDWEARQAAWTRPDEHEIFELVFTSGTTGTPKGVMLTHDNVVASIESFHRIVPPMEHRIVSLLPLSHLLEQAVGLYYALDVGADILYVRSRNPRVIFDALRDHRVTSMVVVPQVLDLFWSAIEREVEKRGRTTAFDRLRSVARHLPMRLRRRLFGAIHTQLGGHFRLFVSAGAFLPPSLQQAWEDLGVTVLQGYGATETGTGTCTTLEDHGLGTVGRPPEGIEMRLADDGEVQFRGPTLFKGYWNAPEATAAAFTDDGWYRTGDIGHLDDAGRLDPVRPEPGHDRAAERLQRLSRRTSRTPCASPASATRSRSRRGPAGSRRSSSRGRQPGRRRPPRPRSAARRRTRPRSGPGSTPPSRPPTRPSGRTSGSPAGGCGPRTTSRGRTRSRSSARRSRPGPRSRAEVRARPVRRRRPAARGGREPVGRGAGRAGRGRDRLVGDRVRRPDGLERGLDRRRRRVGRAARAASRRRSPSCRRGG